MTENTFPQQKSAEKRKNLYRRCRWQVPRVVGEALLVSGGGRATETRTPLHGGSPGRPNRTDALPAAGTTLVDGRPKVTVRGSRFAPRRAIRCVDGDKSHGPGRSPCRPSLNKGKTYPVEILTPDEVRDLAAQCSKTSSSGIRHRALIVLFYRTGLRVGEALALGVKDVNLDVGSIVVLHGKGDRRRTVGIDPGAYEHIEEWIDRRQMLGVSDPAPLFCTLRAGVLKRSEVSGTLHRLTRKAGIAKRVHPHGYVTRTPTS